LHLDYDNRITVRTTSTVWRRGITYLSADLRDRDRTLYKAGDVVWIAGGTVSNSYSDNGCTVAMFSQIPKEQTDTI